MEYSKRYTKRTLVLDKDFFSVEDIRKIISTEKWNCPVHKVWFRLLYSFGMTITELVNLKVQDINFDNQTIKLSGGKRLKNRILKFPKFLTMDLRRESIDKKSEGYLFQGRKGGKVHTRTVQKAIEKIKQKLGLKANACMFRKSLALHLLKCGWDEKGIAHILGHSSARATRKLMGAERAYFERRHHPLDKMMKFHF